MTTAPQLHPDTWLSSRLAAAGIGANCEYPECTNPRTPRKDGQTGPQSKYCPAHNNEKDRQFARRYYQKLERQQQAREQQAALEPPRDPLPQLLARRERDRELVGALGPRLLEALQTINEGEQAAADTDAVQQHIEGVERAASDRIQAAQLAAEKHVEAVEKAALEQVTTARAATVAAQAKSVQDEQAAADAAEERDAALLEAATAQREAAAADAQAKVDRAALDLLTGQHQELRDQHQALTGRHELLAETHEGLANEYRELATAHAELTAAAGRAEGELEVLRPRVSELQQKVAALEAQLSKASADLATVQAEKASQAEQFAAERSRYETEVVSPLRQQLADQATAFMELRTGLAALSPAAEPERDAAEDAPTTVPVEEPEGLELVPDQAHPGAYLVRSAGRTIGTLSPRQSGRWAATHRRRALQPTGQRYFADQDSALRAVADAERTWTPLPPEGDPAWDTIPPWMIQNLRHAVHPVNARKGQISKLEPLDYRRQVHQAIAQIKRRATPLPQHLAVLLDVPQEDLGQRSKPAERLFGVLQQIREHLAPPAAASDLDQP
ncbi:coiled-coil domain-containing protein [Kitasatospora purpeofusca]|uniref:hypothetical protein n=1 Tax=Kitasatospora purpeofusca TaxID=67352 RepID=UPI0036AD3642